MIHAEDNLDGLHNHAQAAQAIMHKQFAQEMGYGMHSGVAGHKSLWLHDNLIVFFAFSRHSLEAAKVGSVRSNVTSQVHRPNHIASLKQAYPSQREETLFSPCKATEEAAWLQPHLQTADKRTRIDLQQTVVVQTKPRTYV